ncbi:MAG: hypothetical protein U5K77_03995 [Candidatus Saccharibacteria bacterium]|nr:hypothetical protein [Candidatus Saccharibacteria bacterium]
MEAIVISVFTATLTTVPAILIYRRIPKKLKVEKYQAKWKELQAFCKDKDTWKEAVIAADALLEDALKRRKFKGSRMGERLVSAKPRLTNNDSAWYAHNLYKKLAGDPEYKLKEDEVKKALLGFRQALRDIGALPGEQQKK